MVKVHSQGEPIGLYDSATDVSLYVSKKADITRDCPGAEKDETVELKFTMAERGRIVQIVEGCACIHFFVDELDKEMRAAPNDDTFGSTARRLGLDKTKLRSIIEQHAPVA